MGVDARGSATANSNTISVAIPGTKAQGDVCIVFLMAANTSPTATWSLTAGTTGWTELLDSNALAIYYKEIGLSEANPSFTCSVTERLAASILKISGYDVATIAKSSAPNTGSDNTSEVPTSATPTQTASHLFIPVVGVEHGASPFVTVIPTNYSNENEVNTGGAGDGATVSTVERVLSTGAAQSPSAFGLTGAQNWVTEIVLIEPATTKQRDASLDGTGTLAGSANKTGSGKASLSGTADLATSAIKTAVGAAALTATGDLAGAGRRGFTGSSALSGLGTLTATAHKTAVGAAALTGTGNLDVIGGGATTGGGGSSGNMKYTGAM